MSKKINYLTLIFIILSLALSGCATSIKYTFDNNLYKMDKPLNYCVLVDVLPDTRSSEEHDGTIYKKQGFVCTEDKLFKPNIDIQISQMLLEHIKTAGVFKSIELRDVSNDLDQHTEEMEALSKENIDLVMVGDLKHFYGFQTNPSPVMFMFGLAGALAEAMANPKTVGAKVEYSNLKIINVHDKKVLWEGNINYEFKEKDTFYDGPASYALHALKETNNKVVQKLKDVL